MTNKEIAVTVTAKVTGISKSVILSASRCWPACEARMVIVLLLSQEGYTDESVSWVLNRKRLQIWKYRRNALATKEISKTFRDKFNRAKTMYDEQKSLRISQG